MQLSGLTVAFNTRPKLNGKRGRRRGKQRACFRRAKKFLRRRVTSLVKRKGGGGKNGGKTKKKRGAFEREGNRPERKKMG